MCSYAKIFLPRCLRQDKTHKHRGADAGWAQRSAQHGSRWLGALESFWARLSPSLPLLPSGGCKSWGQVWALVVLAATTLVTGTWNPSHEVVYEQSKGAVPGQLHSNWAMLFS